MKKLLCLFLGLASIALAQKFTGLAPTPPMGWNSWNTFAGDINESVVRETAEAMIKNGMRDAGYNYLVIDDTWSLKERDAQGNLVADPAKFPSGMKALADYFHANGFKLGIYSCAGTLTCGGYPGSWGHEFQDARTFASWGIDYLKYDWNPNDLYHVKEMHDALRATDRDIVYSISNSAPYADAPLWVEYTDCWRTTGDIRDTWKSISSIGFEQQRCRALGLDGVY